MSDAVVPGSVADKPKVVVLIPQARDPGRESRPHRLDKKRVVLGAVVSADIRLSGEGVAPIHAVIEITRNPASGAELATIYDLASDSGLFVNDEKVVTQNLKTGDTITIGRHRLKFYLEEPEKLAGKERIRVSEGRKLYMSPGEDLTPLLLQDEREVLDIFDYQGTTRPALEVVMSWKGTILDVQHFVDETEVTIGNSHRSDFLIPALLPSAKYPLVTRTQQDHFTLNLDGNMKGVMQRRGRVVGTDELRAQTTRTPDGFAVPLQREDFAKLTVGEIDFYLSFTAAPPRLKSRNLFERDVFLLKILGSSMLLTALTVTALMKVSVPQTIDAEQLPDRIATILYQPEKYEPPVVVPGTHAPVAEHETPVKETPTKNPPVTHLDIKPNPKNEGKPIPKVMDAGHHGGGKAQGHGKVGKHAQGESKQGKGARAKGTEGKRGTTHGMKDNHPQTTAMRPSPQGGNGRGGSHSQVADQGDVDMLKGAASQIENVLGSSAEKLGKGGERLKGFGGFNTAGDGGLALQGGGQGGGGNAATLGGLSNKGIGGGRVGTGLGAAGNGSGIAGGRERVVIRTGGPEEAVVMGSIDADAVEAALLAHKDEFRLCYEREINAGNPNLAGRVSTSFVIGASGRVGQAGIESTTLHNANTERCILDVIHRIQFPMPRGGGIVEVKYPFKYSPVGR